MTKYTVLSSAFSCWYYGFITYALLTLPALLVPEMYFISAMLAFIGSVPAILIFYLLVLLIQHYKIAGYDRTEIHWCVLLAGMFATFAGTLAGTFIITGGSNVLRTYSEFILFPIAAISSAAAAVWSNRNKLYLTIIGKK